MELNLVKENVIELEISVDDTVRVKEEETDGDFSRVKPENKEACEI